MGPRAQHVPALLIAQHAGHGQAASDALGEGDGVGLDAVLLEAEQAAGPAHAGLNLIYQQQIVVFCAVGGQLLDKSLVQRQHTALALDQFQHNGAGVRPGLGLDRIQAVGISVAEALGEGEEVLVEHILTGGLKGGDGAGRGRSCEG